MTHGIYQNDQLIVSQGEENHLEIIPSSTVKTLRQI